MQIWDKLDETIGAGMLTAVAILAMIMGYDHGTAQMCITGIVALLMAKEVKKGRAANNDQRETGKAAT